MTYDIRTAFLVSSVLNLLVPLLFWTVLYRKRNDKIDQWVIGGLLSGLGIMLLSQRDHWADLFTVGLYSLCITSCIAFLWEALDLRPSTAARWMRHAAVLLAVNGLYLWAYYSPYQHLGRAFNVAALAVGALLLTLQAWRASKARPHNTGLRVLIVICGLNALALGERLFFFLATPGPDVVFMPYAGQGMTLLAGAVYGLLSHFAFLWHELEKIHQIQLENDRKRMEQDSALRLAQSQATASAKLLQERDKLLQKLAQASRDTTLGLFAGSLAHEINQPLAAISTNAHFAQRLMSGHKNAPEMLAQVLADIEADTQRAGDIVHQLRNYIKDKSRPQHGHDLNATIQETVQIIDSRARQSHIQIRTNVPAHPLPVLARKIEVQQVLLNLLNNAIDSLSHQDGKPRKLTITAQADTLGTHLIVTDNGAGMSDERFEQLFESVLSSKPEGMGLGLAISHHIMTQAGGHLSAQRLPQGGMLFKASWPVWNEQQGHGQARTAAAASSAARKITLDAVSP